MPDIRKNVLATSAHAIDEILMNKPKFKRIKEEGKKKKKKIKLKVLDQLLAKQLII